MTGYACTDLPLLTLLDHPIRLQDDSRNLYQTEIIIYVTINYSLNHGHGFFNFHYFWIKSHILEVQMKTIAVYIAKQAYVVAFITLCSDKLFLVLDKIQGYGIAHEVTTFSIIH